MYFDRSNQRIFDASCKLFLISEEISGMESRIWTYLVFLIGGMTLGFNAGAQQDPQFSQYMFNQFTYNPAYAGMDNALSATANVRAQWVGITGHPLVQDLSVHSPVSLLHGGAGLQVLNEQEGALRITNVSLAYSFIYKARIGSFSFGINGGIEQVNLDGTKLRAPDGNYENFSIEHNDPLLPVVSVDGLSPDFGAGLFFSSSKLNIGMSATHIVPMAVNLNSSGGDLKMNMERQYYLQASYLAKLGKTLALRPSVYAKSNGDVFQGEADAIFSFNDFFWIGGGFRGYNDNTQDGIIGLAGINIGSNLKIGYSYDYTISPLKAASDGSHELMLNYRVNLIKPAKPGKAIYNPRF
jgi:type IX secretion system PorP/SprF family membrane protein